MTCIQVVAPRSGSRAHARPFVDRVVEPLLVEKFARARNMNTPRADWRVLLAQAWEGYARFSLRGGKRQRRRQHQQHPTSEHCPKGAIPRDTGDNEHSASRVHLDHASRCLEESLRVHQPGCLESLTATTVLAAVAVEQGQLDRASALLSITEEQILPELDPGADG